MTACAQEINYPWFLPMRGQIEGNDVLVMHRGLATVMLEYLQYMEESDIGDSEDRIVSSQPMYDIQVQQHNVQVHP